MIYIKDGGSRLQDYGSDFVPSEGIYWQYTNDYENQERFCAARGVWRERYYG